MKRFTKLKYFVIAGGISSPVMAQMITGSSMALQSSGSASGSGWVLNSDGYVGTYINLSAPRR